jgi:hypothetical protein
MQVDGRGDELQLWMAALEDRHCRPELAAVLVRQRKTMRTTMRKDNSKTTAMVRLRPEMAVVERRHSRRGKPGLKTTTHRKMAAKGEKTLTELLLGDVCMVV